MKQHLFAPESAAVMLSALILFSGFAASSPASGKPAGYVSIPAGQLNMAVSMFYGQ